jgi:hypothetical protein
MDAMTDSSSTRHNLGHQYAANHDQFPGWLGTGTTAQSINQPEILAQSNVGQPATRRADRKPSNRARANRKSG